MRQRLNYWLKHKSKSVLGFLIWVLINSYYHNFFFRQSTPNPNSYSTILRFKYSNFIFVSEVRRFFAVPFSVRIERLLYSLLTYLKTWATRLNNERIYIISTYEPFFTHRFTILIRWHKWRLPTATDVSVFIGYGILASIIIVYYLLATTYVPVGGPLFAMNAVLGVLCTLTPGFVYFLNRTSYGRFTDVLYRFWKRSFSVFWLIEGGLFLIFIYLTLTAASEVIFTYDTPAVLKTRFFSTTDFLNKSYVFILFLAAICGLIFLNRMFRFTQLLFLHFLVTTFFIMLALMEAGSFFSYINYIGGFKNISVIELDENGLESEISRSRVIHLFVLTCAVVKFWHFFLVGIMWFFNINIHNDDVEAREILLASIFQSFLILFFLNFVILIPQFAFLMHKYMENPYYWFFQSPHYPMLRHAVVEIFDFYYIDIAYFFPYFDVWFNTPLPYDFYTHWAEE